MATIGDVLTVGAGAGVGGLIPDPLGTGFEGLGLEAGTAQLVADIAVAGVAVALLANGLLRPGTSTASIQRGVGGGIGVGLTIRAALA